MHEWDPTIGSEIRTSQTQRPNKYHPKEPRREKHPDHAVADPVEGTEQCGGIALGSMPPALEALARAE
jgi:hypothetical protein